MKYGGLIGILPLHPSSAWFLLLRFTQGLNYSLAKGIGGPAFSRRMACGSLWLVELISDVLNVGLQMAGIVLFECSKRACWGLLSVYNSWLDFKSGSRKFIFF
jgi:hypothetical protein